MLELSDKDVKTVMRGKKKRPSISNYHYTIINKQMRKKVESLSKEIESISKELNGNYTIIQLENTITEMKSLVEGLNSRMQ